MLAGVPQIILDEMSKPNVAQVRLFSLGGNPTLLYTDADTDVVWAGQVYKSKGISYNRVKSQLGIQVDTYQVSIDNLDDFLIAWALANDPTGYQSGIFRGFLTTPVTKDVSGRLTLIADYAIPLFSGTNTNVKADVEFTVYVKSNTDLQQQRSPKSTQDVTCRFKGQNGFKGPNCGYDGGETTCNFTFARCTELGHNIRFGGFPYLNSNTRS